MRTIVEWVRGRELAAAGVSHREIARRLQMNRRTVARLAGASEPPRYRRAPSGSALDPLEPVMRQVLADWPQIHAPRMTEILRGHGYTGSERVVRRRLGELRPPAQRAAQRTGYAPGQVAQVDWTEMPTRPTHTFASMCIAAGVNARGLMAYLGHASIQMTFDRYGHLMPGSESEAAELLNAYLHRSNGTAKTSGAS